jgi:hypothetical protein
VGRKDDADQLPEDLRAMESPNARKPLAEVAFEITNLKSQKTNKLQ